MKAIDSFRVIFCVKIGFAFWVGSGIGRNFFQFLNLDLIQKGFITLAHKSTKTRNILARGGDSYHQMDDFSHYIVAKRNAGRKDWKYIQKRLGMVYILNLGRVWPDWVIYWTLGNFSKQFAAISLPKSSTFLGNLTIFLNVSIALIF